MLVIRTEELSATVLPEIGGRIHRLQAFGRDVLRTPEDPAVHAADPFSWGAFPLVPWSNRVPRGRLVFRDRVVNMPPNFPDGSAIHGEAYARPWELMDESELVLRGGIYGFPWPYEARMTYSLDGASLFWRLSVQNIGDSDMPAGLGIHPWFEGGKSLQLAVPAQRTYSMERDIPVGEPIQVSGALDRRLPGVIPSGTDNLWTGLTDDTLALEWPGSGLRATFGWSARVTHLVVAAFARFDAVAVEPVTHATDGFTRLAKGLSGGVDVLSPGETLSVQYVLAFEQT